MNELKTLNDFKVTYDNGTSFFELDGWRTNCGEHFVKKLKSEAIKWVKEIEKTLIEGLAVERPDEVLKRFFNISEEDLE